MAVRTNAAAVTTAIDTTLTTPQVEAFITDASVWVDDNLVGKGLSATVLETIEKYLACHFVTLRDPRLKSAVFDKVGEVYQRDLYITEYLKAAAALDSTGTIEDRLMSGRPKVSFRAGEGFDDTLDLPVTSA